MQNIPYGRQSINQDDIDAVVQVLRAPFITQGPAIAQFEQGIASYSSAKHAVAVSSGTAALHLALLALDVGEGDVVWTCPISFVASSNCALYVGAKVDFVDCDLATGNMDIDALEQKLKTSKKLPKVVIPVHFSGRVCPMERVAKLAKEYGFKVIEDAAHALGASYPTGEKVGCNKYADLTMFSFHPVKSITTGEGGVLTTNDPKLVEKLSLLRSHGITRDADKMQNPVDGPWYYEQIDLGYHYRITDIQAALGSSQLKRLDQFVSKRKEVANYYNQALANLPITLAQPDENSAWHLFVIGVDPQKRKYIFENLRAAGVGVNVHYIPIHLQPYYQKLGFGPGQFPNAEAFYSRSISLPIFPELTIQERQSVAQTLSKIIEN